MRVADLSLLDSRRL